MAEQSLREHLQHDSRGLLTEKSILNENHKRHGVCQFFTHGRLTMEITYANGQQQGPAAFHHLNGKIQATMVHEKDHLHGEKKSYDEHGALTMLETYKNGQLHGPYKSYHPGGELHQEGVFEDHLKVGPWHTYDPKATRVKTEHYEKGVRTHIDEKNEEDEE